MTTTPVKLLVCAECGVALTTVEAEDLVATEAGPVHRECFQGPVPPGSALDADEALDLAAENDRRLQMGDPPLDLEEEVDFDQPSW